MSTRRLRSHLASDDSLPPRLEDDVAPSTRRRGRAPVSYLESDSEEDVAPRQAGRRRLAARSRLDDSPPARQPPAKRARRAGRRAFPDSEEDFSASSSEDDEMRPSRSASVFNDLDDLSPPSSPGDQGLGPVSATRRSSRQRHAVDDELARLRAARSQGATLRVAAAPAFSHDDTDDEDGLGVSAAPAGRLRRLSRSALEQEDLQVSESLRQDLLSGGGFSEDEDDLAAEEMINLKAARARLLAASRRRAAAAAALAMPAAPASLIEPAAGPRPGSRAAARAARAARPGADTGAAAAPSPGIDNANDEDEDDFEDVLVSDLGSDSPDPGSTTESLKSTSPSLPTTLAACSGQIEATGAGGPGRPLGTSAPAPGEGPARGRPSLIMQLLHGRGASATPVDGKPLTPPAPSMVRALTQPCSDAETLSPRRRRSRLVLDGDIDQASAGAAPAGAPIAALDYDSTTRPFQLSDVALGPHADPMARTMVVLAGTGRRDARAGSDSDRSAGWWPPSDAEADSDLDDFIEHDTSSEEEHEEEGPAGDDQPGAGPVTSGRVGPFRTIDQYFRHGAGRAPRPRPALLAHFPYIRCLPPPHDTVGLFLFHRLYMALGFREVEDAERGASGDGDADVPSPHLHALRRALGTIRRRADTYRGSLVSSSTWRPDFELALRSFFDFDFVAPGGGAQTRAPIGRGARRALSDGIGAGYMCYACRRPHRGADPVIVRLSDRAVDGMPPGPEDPPPLREDLEGEHASNPGDVGHDGDHSDPLSPDVHDTLAGDLRRAARDALAESGRTLAPAAGPSDDGLPSSEATLFHVRIAADGREAEYLVGRQCAQRSDVYHRLVHLEQRLEHGIKLEVLRHRIDHPSAGRLELLDLISSDAEWLAAGRHQVADTLDAASAFRG